MREPQWESLNRETVTLYEASPRRHMKATINETVTFAK